MATCNRMSGTFVRMFVHVGRHTKQKVPDGERRRAELSGKNHFCRVTQKQTLEKNFIRGRFS